MQQRISLSQLVRKWGFVVTKAYEQGNMVIVNFRDPRLENDIYFISSIVYDRAANKAEALVRTLVTGYRELYMEYCCEHGEMKCRPHIYIEDGKTILSIEAKFTENPVEKLNRLLEELSPQQ